MAVAVPNIGSRVRVTTVYPNTYAYRGEDNNYVTYTREGEVVQSIFRDPFMFAVKTGDPDHPVSEYNAKSLHVVKIEYIIGGSKQVATDKKAWKVKSEDGSKFYIVQRIEGKFSCTCKGFEFRKDCKHIGAVSKK
jgi:SWIM zinc finger